MNDMIAWFRAQLDDDEQRINEHPLTTYFHAPDHGEYRAMMAGTDPVLTLGKTRALAEVDAKRRILDEWEDEARGLAYCEREGDYEAAQYSLRLEALERVVRLVGLPYADRSGYEESWRPE
jgi:hypothetical protein